MSLALIAAQSASLNLRASCQPHRDPEHRVTSMLPMVLSLLHIALKTHDILVLKFAHRFGTVR